MAAPTIRRVHEISHSTVDHGSIDRDSNSSDEVGGF